MNLGRYFGFILLLILPFSASAQNNAGLQFLNIGPGPQSLSISEAHTAVPMNSASLFTNPANMIFSEQSNLDLSYTLWIGDTQHTQGSFLYRRENDVFAAGLLSSVIDDITVRSTPGPADGTFSVRYLAISGGYARFIGPLAAGVTASYLYEQLFQSNASGLAISGGLTAQMLEQRVRIGTSLNYLGSMSELQTEASPLPTTWKIGFDANVLQVSAFGGSEVPVIISLSGDFVMPLDEAFDSEDGDLIESGNYFAFGMEAELYDIVSVRGGYRTGDTVRSYSFGAGIHVDPVRFTYAFVPFETGFGMVHSIGMQYFFNL